jgi:hypothetical protein
MKAKDRYKKILKSYEWVFINEVNKKLMQKIAEIFKLETNAVEELLETKDEEMAQYAMGYLKNLGLKETKGHRTYTFKGSLSLRDISRKKN